MMYLCIIRFKCFQRSSGEIIKFLPTFRNVVIFIDFVEGEKTVSLYMTFNELVEIAQLNLDSEVLAQKSSTCRANRWRTYCI